VAKKRIVILGAGLAGLSTAWHLRKKGIACQIFEKESEAGGLCRSKNIAGFTFDYDGHLLHFKHRYTFNLIKSLLKNNLVEHQRSAWVYSFGRYSRYPFQANLYGFPSPVIKNCLLGFIQISRNGHNKNSLNFLDWINHTFGKGISRYFMIPYNTKFWTVPPQELTCEWLDGFIPVPSLNQIIEGTIKESHRQFGYNARFWYPKEGGISSLSSSFANQLKNIHTDCPVAEINLEKRQIKLASGARERFDYLVSTIPLPEMPFLVKGLPKQVQHLFKRLRWNSIFNLNLGLPKKNTSEKHWIYFPQKDVRFFRVGFPHNFSSCLAPKDKSSLYVEVAYSKDKPVVKNKITPRIIKDLKKTGLLTEGDRICAQDINDIKYGYPIYDKNYTPTRKNILGFLNRNNIISCGRYGSWRYMSMEDVILEGKGIADRISGMV